jgi:hypothetical protein
MYARVGPQDRSGHQAIYSQYYQVQSKKEIE